MSGWLPCAGLYYTDRLFIIALPKLVTVIIAGPEYAIAAPILQMYR